jgi:nicotinamide mononucleotide transporter
MAGSISASTEIVNYFTTLPVLELVAVITSLLYVVLAAKGNLWCWPAAILSTVLYTVIFYDVYLWMDSALQLYYLLMAVYGWLCWRKNAAVNSLNDDVMAKSRELRYSQWTLQRHSTMIIALTLLSLVLGWLMATYTPTHFPYLDSATTVFAVFATYLLTQKVLENWLYFIIIDFVSIYLYIEKGLIPTAALFACYVILASYGYWQWRKLYLQQKSNGVDENDVSPVLG